MKKILLIISLILFINLNFVSAMDWDNVVNYEEDDKVAVFVNALGLGDTIARAELITPMVNYIIPGKDRRVMIFKIENYGEIYENGLKDMEIKNMWTEDYELKSFYFEYAVYENVVVDDYSDKCIWTPEDSCYLEKIGSHVEQKVKEWRRFDSTNILKGNITLAMVTNVNQGDYYDGIPILFGKRISRWASWQDGLGVGLEAYWKMDDVLSDFAEESLGTDNDLYNLQTDEWDTGKIGGCYDTASDALISKTNISALDWNGVTINFWFKSSSGSIKDGGEIITYVFTDDAAEEGIWIGEGSTGKLDLLISGEDRIEEYYTFTDNVWEMITVTVNYTSATMYADTVIVLEEAGKSFTLGNYNFTFFNDWDGGGAGGNGFFIDEIAIWNRSLSPDEIDGLYNSGSGFQYSVADNISINLISPDNNTQINITSFINTHNFIANVSSFNGFTLENATLYIWDEYDSEIATNFTVLSGTNKKVNSTVFNLSFKNYVWNFKICANDSTITECQFYETNRTLKIGLEYIETYNTETFEGNNETFTINITLSDGTTISNGFLIYNGISYSGTIDKQGDNYYLNRLIYIPNIETSSNITFYWDLTLNNIHKYNSSFHNQSVINFIIDDCNTYSDILFNISLYDEDDQSFLAAGTQNTSIDLFIDIYSEDRSIFISNFSANFSYINPVILCIESGLGSSVYSLDGIIKYSSLNRFIEFYNFQNYNLNSSTSNISISLYNLNSSKGQEFKITYKDENFIPVTSALLNIQRKYISEGVFKTIELPKTGNEGYTMGHLITNDVIYTIIVSKNGEILATFEDIVADCQTPALSSCQINLNSFSTSTLPTDFKNYKNMSFTLIYDSDSREISSVYTITTGIPATVDLNVTLYDSLGTTNVCSDSLISSGGTLTCEVPISFGNSTVIAQLRKDNIVVGSSIIKIKQNPRDIYGGSIMFVALFCTLLLIGIGITDNPMALGIVMAVSLIVLVAMNIVYSPSLIGTGATILWFIIAIVIILIKGSSRQ